MPADLLVIDNYDSFTFNLVQMFRQYDLRIAVFRSDTIDLEQIKQRSPDYILVSPGPKDPEHAGISIPLIKRFYTHIPILGVCLGMQCLNEALGGKTVRAPLPMHGKTSVIRHYATGLFSGLPTKFSVARYHSLMVADVPDDLVATAHSEDGVVMAISHRFQPLHGVQFHPESFLTQQGYPLIENFLALGPLVPHRTKTRDAYA